MRRRSFLHELLLSGLGALVADRAGAGAQEAAPSRLAEGRSSATAQSTANLRAARHVRVP
jgi:hypothetical protein